MDHQQSWLHLRIFFFVVAKLEDALIADNDRSNANHFSIAEAELDVLTMYLVAWDR